MRWMLLRSPINLAFMPYEIAIGIFNRHVQPVVMVCTKVSTGYLVSWRMLRKRTELVNDRSDLKNLFACCFLFPSNKAKLIAMTMLVSVVKHQIERCAYATTESVCEDDFAFECRIRFFLFRMESWPAEVVRALARSVSPDISPFTANRLNH